MKPWPLAPALLLLTLAGPSPAEPTGLGPITGPDELGTGGFLIRHDDGLRAAPLLETDVEIRVTGPIARTRVSQRFENPGSEWVEGVYVFPLPEKAAVDTLLMRVGDRRIEGRIEERVRAKARYQQAKREGRKASLVEQERPNVFTTTVANLGPGERVEVTLEYQEMLPYDQGRFALRFPMVVAPRYVPSAAPIAGTRGGEGEAESEEDDSEASAEVPDAARITPPIALPGGARWNPVRLGVRIDAGFRLEDVESASHPVRVRARRGAVYEVEPEEGPIPANCDFLLSWRPVAGAQPNAALFRETWKGEHFALLMVLPPSPERAAPTRLSRETIIVIDTSGSMAGASIDQARRAVVHALSALRPEDAFNVIRFDSRFERLFDAARPAHPVEIAEAIRWVENLEAEGGTEMRPALEAALREGPERRAVRQVIFVTDGAIGNEASLLEAVAAGLGRSRLYPIGIGSAPNDYLLRRVARLGRGTATSISRPDEVRERMGELFAKLDAPILHDLELDWSQRGVEAWPERLPDVYLGEPIVVAARLPKPSSSVRLRGRRGPDTLDVALATGAGSRHAGVARLWARRKIAGLMDSLHEGADAERVRHAVTGLGVRHHLVTRWTSLVAIDVRPTAPVDARSETRGIPSLLPRGWSLWKVFGGEPARPPAHATPPPAPSPDPALRTVSIGSAPGVRIGGPLPRGATPSGLLIGLGTGLMGLAALAGLAGRWLAARTETR